ncbi:MAG: Rpn family recombination-promoting nuclease/putative transposase, partial [Prevotellaceae bacterium]|nr:Rpn family recombination-promoting nuclease/putative transposase [Prevotellaceae bacterium]
MGKRINQKQVAAEPDANATGKAEEQVYMNLLTDFAFKKVFGIPEVMVALLNDTLQPRNRIVSV